MGFRRIARRTGITATRLPIGAGEVLTTEAGVRPGGGTARMGGRLLRRSMGQSLALRRAMPATVVDERQGKKCTIGGGRGPECPPPGPSAPPRSPSAHPPRAALSPATSSSGPWGDKC
jgi:hypothetical protein